jgi:hypothetical protein
MQYVFIVILHCITVIDVQCSAECYAQQGLHCTARFTWNVTAKAKGKAKGKAKSESKLRFPVLKIFDVPGTKNI